MKNSDKKGITFIEIIVVTSIIMVLAGLLLPALTRARAKAKKGETLVRMDSIAAAITLYESDFGSYPPDDTLAGVAGYTGGESLWYHLGATFIKGANSPMNAGPFIDLKATGVDYAAGAGANVDFDGDSSANNAVQTLVDAWGNALNYDCCPGAHNTSSYDLSSPGPDGASGTSDDVTNWS